MLSRLIELLSPAFARNRWLALSYLLILLLALMLSLLYTRTQIILYLNQFHSQTLDYLMLGLSYLGTAPAFLGLLFLIRVCYKHNHIIYSGLLAFASTSIITQTLKRVFFYDVWRPLAVIPRETLYIPFPEQIELQHSFPSGHASVAFTILALVFYYSSKPYLSWLTFLLALLVAYSRMYLLRHFLIDVSIGSLIGFGGGILSIALWEAYRLRRARMSI